VRGRASRGVILVETTLTLAVLGLAIAALMPLFVLSVRVNKSTERIAVASNLAASLLEEVRLRRWDETTPLTGEWTANASPLLGPDLGEAPADKTAFDDLDDFAGWREEPPTDPVGRPVPGLERYVRRVEVAYLDAALEPSLVPTDRKRIRSCAWMAGMREQCVETIATNH